MAAFPGAKRTLLSVLVSLVLVTTAVGSVWLMASAGVFETSPNAVPRPTTGVVTGSTLAWTPITLSNVGIFGQPRDPFKPL
ncbi:hypothetical protein HQ535_09355, partial [bacterium]|nr:hypothetical protein [bacterium]